MPQPSLTDVFPGATQTATGVTIPWSAMPGITASVTNNADKTLAGITAAALAYYSLVRRDGNAAAVPPTTGDKDVSLIVEMGRVGISSSYDAQNNRTDFEEQTVEIRFYKPRSTTGFDPDDY